MGLGPGQQDEGQGGGDAAVEDRRSHKLQSFLDPLFPGPLMHDEVSVRDVRAVVDAQADGDDQVDGRDDVDGEAPEVHEPADVDQREDDHEEDQQGSDDVADDDGRRDEDADHGERQVDVELLGDHLISFPAARRLSIAFDTLTLHLQLDCLAILINLSSNSK